MMNKNILFCLIAIFLIFNVYAGNAGDICSGEDGCKLAIKTRMLVPLRDQLGQPILDLFNWKIMLIYEDRLVIFQTNDQSQTFDRHEPPNKLARSISWDQITLDCGYGMKFCLMGEFEKVAKNGVSSFYNPPKQVSDYSADGYMSDYKQRCIVIPIIDNGDHSLLESTVTMCWANTKYQQILEYRNILSKFADIYQLGVTNNEYMSGNGIIQKESNFHALVSDGQINPVKVILNNHMILAYTDPKNFASLGQQISLRQLNHQKYVLSVSKAILKQYTSLSEFEAWISKYGLENKGDSGSSFSDCCLYIPLKKPLNDETELFTIMCVHMTKQMIAQQQQCAMITKRWATIINQKVLRNSLLNDVAFFRFVDLDSQICANEGRSRQFESIVKRIQQIAQFEHEICQEYRVLDNFDDIKCKKILEDDITNQISTISGLNAKLNEKLIKCVKDNEIDISQEGTQSLKVF